MPPSLRQTSQKVQELEAQVVTLQSKATVPVGDLADVWAAIAELRADLVAHMADRKAHK